MPVEKNQKNSSILSDYSFSHSTTKLGLKDIILDAKTATRLEDVKIWLQHNKAFLKNWKMEKRVKPGCRVLFSGPSGTGKTMAAEILANELGLDIYRIDLSALVNKYIGETEKNLRLIFDAAQQSGVILFFDEADALFGKRSEVKDAHDRYANIETSYLSERMEEYRGTAILATNNRNNIDETFFRRLNIIVEFPMPDTDLRKRIWESSISPKANWAKEVDLKNISEKYELSGGSIVNIMQYASLKSISKKSTLISKSDIIEGIRREFEKEGKEFAD
jgi:SpoVK/Ycf46/Vps4 family AAA+-type ATPase